jgi:hypothetical protein
MRPLVSVCVLLLLAGAAVGQEALGPKTLTLSPALPPEPALKLRLLPELIEQRPGNAADFYRKSSEKVHALPNDLVVEASDWLDLPLENMPLNRVRALLAECKEVFETAEAGARSESCDWGLSTRLREKGIYASLEDMQRMRTLIVLFRVRMRLEILEKRYDQAVSTARMGLTMARHVGTAPTLISSLIGIAMATITLNGVEELMAQPGAPNLVWALAALPHPFFNLQQAFEGDRLSVYGTFPGMDRVFVDHDADLTAGEHRKISEFLTKNGKELGFSLNRTALAALLVAKDDQARTYLEKAGWSPERLKRMSTLQAALLHSLTEYDRQFDELLKWQALPYWEAEPALFELKQLRQKRREKGLALLLDNPALPLAELLIPASEKILQARVRLDRRIAALTMLEAIRLHAANHGGQLPASLADMRSVPVPVDPGTGKPFTYRVEGTRAFLSAPLLRGQAASAASIISYEISFRPQL